MAAIAKVLSKRCSLRGTVIWEAGSARRSVGSYWVGPPLS